MKLVAMLRTFFILLLAMTSSDAMQAIQRDPVSHETATRQARPRLAGEKFDPQESDLRLRNVFAAADREAERGVANVRRDERFIFHFWSIKKRILRRKYGIDWKTPAELNPSIVYDSYGQ